MKTNLLITLAIFSFYGCLRLDNQLYNNQKVDEYLLDNYTGAKECADLPPTYNIADSLIHRIQFTSQSRDGSATIYGVYLGNMQQIKTDTVILYCHGNAKHLDNYWNRAKLLANLGHKNRFGVLIFDYRGYGKSTGTPTEENLYADTDAALKWLQANGLTSNRLVVYGYSLGSAPACEITSTNYTLKPFKIILEAPFASSAVMVQDGSKLALPGSYFTNAKINNVDKVKTMNQPLCWLHGYADSFLSITTHGELVYKNHGGANKIAHRINHAEHGNVPTVWGYPTYLNAMLNFITQP